MTSIKLTYENETRRVLLRENGDTLTYSRLMNTLLNLFPTLCGKTFHLTWEDDEGDLIMCSSDAELEDAIHVMNSSSRTLKFGVKILSNEASGASHSGINENAAGFVHQGVTCDECGVCPIVGVRYKCAVRHNFDMCKRCEAKKLQPFPVIKIVDPEQAPEVLIFGLRDGQRNEEGPGGFGGRHWQRGFRHHPPPPHHHHPPHHPPFHHGPPPPPPSAQAEERWYPGRGSGGRRCGWGRKFEKFASDLAKDPTPIAQAVSPFIAALDDVVQHFTGGASAGPASATATATATSAAATDNSAAASASANGAKPDVNETSKPSHRRNEEAQLEEQLLEQAILESLTINNSNSNGNSGHTDDATKATAAPVVAKPSETGVVYVETSKPAVPTLPKPALRFVRDVTFPDGTSVQPGAVFRKAWRVRNDGNHAWPEGANLVSVGGDVLSDPSHKEALAVVHPEQEAEIALQLTAPDLPGMYTAYYRAQTKEQQYFGQRLWAAIVVADHEPNDWQMISEQQKSANADAFAPEVGSSPAAPVSVPPAIAASAPSSAEPPVAANEPKTAAPENSASASAPSAAFSEVAAIEQSTPSPPQPESTDNARLRSVMLLWRRELAILSDMGFDDVDAILPLLQQHFQSPLSLSADKNAAPNVEAMQRVVAALLSLQH